LKILPQICCLRDVAGIVSLINYNSFLLGTFSTFFHDIGHLAMFRAYVVMLKDMPTGACSPSIEKNWPDLILKGEFLPAKD